MFGYYIYEVVVDSHVRYVRIVRHLGIPPDFCWWRRVFHVCTSTQAVYLRYIESDTAAPLLYNNTAVAVPKWWDTGLVKRARDEAAQRTCYQIVHIRVHVMLCVLLVSQRWFRPRDFFWPIFMAHLFFSAAHNVHICIISEVLHFFFFLSYVEEKDYSHYSCIPVRDTTATLCTRFNGWVLHLALLWHEE